MELKEFLIKNIISNKNKIIPKRINLEWFLKNNFENEWNELNLIFNEFGFFTISDKIKMILFDMNEPNKCIICSTYILKNLFRNICSISCATKTEEYKEKKKKTCLEKYGVEHPSQTNQFKEKYKKTCLEKYGVEHSFQSDIIQSKIKSTNLNRYGNECSLHSENGTKKTKKTLLEKFEVDNISKSKYFKDTYKKTCLDRYGVDSYSKTPEYLVKIKNTNQTNLGVDYPSQSKTIINKSKLSLFKHWYNNYLMDNYDFIPLFTENDYDLEIEKRLFKCKKCNNIFNQWSLHLGQCRCTKCKPLFSSQYETEIEEFINSFYKVEYSTKNRKIIQPKELDFYFPEHSIAIEFNGIYWHSYGIDDIEYSNYHLDKTNQCREKGIQLFHIFENEWLDIYKNLIWKSIIKQNLGVRNSIFARKCEIREISFKAAQSFLLMNHLQGKCKSSINFGLFFNEELISVLCMSKSRFNKNYDWEILRYCNKINISVIGGFSKLLSHFRKNHEGSIITYADKRYSVGNVYKQNGFIEFKDSPPNYYYVKKCNLYSRQQFQKHKLKDKLETFDPNLTEWENMRMNGFRRIWDSGNKVFTLS